MLTATFVSAKIGLAQDDVKGSPITKALAYLYENLPVQTKMAGSNQKMTDKNTAEYSKTVCFLDVN